MKRIFEQYLVETKKNSTRKGQFILLISDTSFSKNYFLLKGTIY